MRFSRTRSSPRRPAMPFTPWWKRTEYRRSPARKARNRACGSGNSFASRRRWRTTRTYPGSAAEQPARLCDILRDLRLERVDAGKTPFLAQAVDKLHPQPAAVHVAGEVEQVHFQGERRAPGCSGECAFRMKGRIEAQVRGAADGFPLRQQPRADR